MTPRRPLLMLVTEPHRRLAEIAAAAVAGGVDIVQWREKGESPHPPTPSPAEGRRGVRDNREAIPAGVGQVPTCGCRLITEGDLGLAAVLTAGPTESPSPITSSSPLPSAGEGPGVRDSYPALRAAVASPALLIANAGSGSALPEDADGMHLPEHGGSIAGARRRYGERVLIGRSVHGIESALQAETDGADYVIAGTIFASNSHPGEAPAGLEFLRAVCAAVRIPVIAIGGIVPGSARACLDAGAAGVAVLSPIMRADDPRRAAEEYRRALDGC